MNKRRFFEITTAAWALALVIMGGILLTPDSAEAGWINCGTSCAIACSSVGSDCESYFTWQGCGCTVYCENGEEGDVVCI